MGTTQQWNQFLLNNFLNPPKGNMNSAEYAQLKRDRAQMWANFVYNNKTTGIR